jgi:hypothetical protein
MRRSHPELDGTTPLDAAATEHDMRYVERVLISAELGLPV